MAQPGAHPFPEASLEDPSRCKERLSKSGSGGGQPDFWQGQPSVDPGFVRRRRVRCTSSLKATVFPRAPQEGPPAPDAQQVALRWFECVPVAIAVCSAERRRIFIGLALSARWRGAAYRCSKLPAGVPRI